MLELGSRVGVSPGPGKTPELANLAVHLLAASLQASHSTSLCLGFPICKMGIIATNRRLSGQTWAMC